MIHSSGLRLPGRYNTREAELRTLRLEVERLGGAVSSAEDDARRRAEALRERLAAQQAQLAETQAHLETTQARLHARDLHLPAPGHHTGHYQSRATACSAGSWLDLRMSDSRCS